MTINAPESDLRRYRIRIRHQVKVIRGKRVFAPPKNDNPHEVPLPDSLALALSEHIQTCPSAAVILPRKAMDQFFTKVIMEPSALNVPSGATS